jgi:hypothetical protein
VLRHRYPVWDPIRVTHLGQRSFDRTIQAGHMTATDQAHLSCYALARRGPSTYGLPLFAGVTIAVTCGCDVG